MRFETLGETPAGTSAAVLIHRAGGSAHGWFPVMEQLGESRRLIAIELPGHGNSRGAPLTTLDEMANHVNESLNSLGLESVVLVGHSMGGAVALTMALSHPERVQSLFLVASAAKLRVAKHLMALMRDRFDELTGLAESLGFAWGDTLFDAPREVVLTDMEACHRFDLEDRLNELRCPLTLLVGSEDHLTPPRLGRRMKDRAPGMTFDVINGAGHMLPQEKPDRVADMIRKLTKTSETHDG